ncbi:MAG: hypothetical protein CMJ48_10810 [Planctomycetaceae bacterium]|nr:hypothetical protein [Planctomycetaceae bacterium]
MATASDLESICKSAQRAVRKRDYVRAQELFQQALEIDELHIKAHEGLAAAAFLSRDCDLAIKHFTRITQLNPAGAEAFVNLGAVLNRRGEHQKAVDTIRKGLQKNSRSAQGYYNLGIAHKQLNQLAMAVSAYREAVRIQPNMAEAHQNLGNVHLEMGALQQAAVCYRKALELRPDFEKAKTGLKRVEDAIEAAKQNVSPFGRLVDEESYRPKAAQVATRDLSVEERVQDRTELQEISVEIIVAARTFLEHLRTSVEPTILALSRAVVQGTKEGDIVTQHDEFRKVVQECHELRHELRRNLLELRAHEELINMPDFDPDDVA